MAYVWPMADKKPRILQGTGDMVWTLAPLIVACLLVAGLVGQCSWSPGGPTEGAIPTFDAAGALDVDAQIVDYPLRMPQVPAEWTPNSGSRRDIGSATASTVGFVTSERLYLQLTQSDAPAQALAGAYANGTADRSGTEQVGGVDWLVFEDATDEPLWVADLDDVRILITGSGTNDDYVTLAQAVMAAAPIEP